MRFGIIADDYTGASDAASMLTERGVRTALCLDLPERVHLQRLAQDFDAVVLGLRTRAIAPADAYRETAQAARLLLEVGAEKIQVKYCSTFDSTPRGNIGPSLDAVLEATGAEATIVAPALPVNGRTTYCGYHFVHGQLLSESPLRDHPLNPMTDANLVRWLQQQTPRKVALAPLPVVRRGVAGVLAHLGDGLAEGSVYFVVDAVEQNDLSIAVRATEAWPVLSGGSGITAEIPGLMFPDGGQLCFAEQLSGCAPGTLVIAGSCSPATRDQNAFAQGHGFLGLRCDGVAVLEGELSPAALAAEAGSAMAHGQGVVLTTSSNPAEVLRVQRHGQTMGLSETQVGERIATALAACAARLIEHDRLGRLIVSGGETSGAVCRELGLRALEVGLPIDPGVPYCFPLSGPPLLVVLKSGNFGAPGFYLKVRGLGA